MAISRFEKIVDRNIEKFLLLMASISVIAVFLIIVFLFKEGMNIFQYTSLKEFFLGELWYPTSDPAKFGIFTLIVGTLLVTFLAIAISVPLSLAAAIYLAEIAHPLVKSILKPIIELLAGIPSVVYGFFGLVVIVPFIQKTFSLPVGTSAIAGALMLSIVALPTIVSVSEDAISSVPHSFKEASLALGTTHWQTIRNVLLPAASSGIVTAIILGIGRIVGETMVVLMITGNAAIIPKSIFDPVRTMTATIAIEMGETVQGDSHYFALFEIGVVLFILTFLINLTADLIIARWRKGMQ